MTTPIQQTSAMVWIIPTLVSTALYGFYNFGARVSAARGYRSSVTIFISTLTVFIAAGLTIGYRVRTGMTPLDTTPWMAILLMAAGNGFFFATGSSLKFNTLFVVLLSLPVFGEMPNPRQWTGILLALASIILLSGSNQANSGQQAQSSESNQGIGGESRKCSRGTYCWGLALALLSALTTALSALINKTAAIKGDRIAFVAFSYAVSAAISGLMAARGKGGKTSLCKGQVFLGLLMGLLNFIGFVLILKAFSLGPLSVIHPIFSMSMVISVTLSTIVFREPFGLKTAFALVAAIVAVLLVA